MPFLLALLSTMMGGSSGALGQTNAVSAPASGVEAASAATKNESAGRILVQIRILGLRRISEDSVRSRLKAREWAPYSAQDKALDVAALLASGDFSSVKATEIALSSASARLDIELIEASEQIVSSTATAELELLAPVAAETADASTSTLVEPPPLIQPPRWATETSEPALHGKAAPAGGLPPPWAIGDIAIEGNRHVKYNVVRAQLKARKGDLYDRADLDRDIKALYDLGNFDRVVADISALADKPIPSHLRELAGSTIAVRLSFTVQEKPLVHKIRFRGNKKLSSGKLSDAIGLKEKDPLDPLKLREDSSKLLALYHEKGYLGAEVEPQVSVDTPAARAEVSFNVQEGPRTLIAAVVLDGLHAFSARKVLKKMENRRKKVLQESKLESDLKKIESLYKNNGYLDFKISSHAVSFSEDRTKATITLRLDEGHPYRYGVTTFSGYSVYASSQLAKTLEYRRGKIFNQEKFETTIHNIQDLYADKGYLRARVTPDKTYNETTQQMDVHFRIGEGQVIYVDHVDVEGNRATKTYVLKREIVLKPGQPFSSSRARKSRERMMNLNFLDDVELDLQSTSDPDKVDLTFEVTEGKPGMLTAGAGFSSLDGLIGTLSLQHLNLFGRAQRASVQWSFGARVQDYSLSWTTPWVRNKPISFGLDLFNTRRLQPFGGSLSAYVNRRQGGSVRVGPRFADDKYRLDFRYTFMEIGITNVQNQFMGILSQGTSMSSSIGIEFARDTRDNMWDPADGTLNSLGMEMSGGPVLGDIHYWSPRVHNAAHFTLARVDDWPLVLSFSNRLSYVTPFGNTKEVPIFARFFLGGQDTLRGYSPSGQVGPPNGGRVFDVFNLEMGFPLARERKRTIVKFVTFFDAGTAWQSTNSMRLRVGPGEQDIKTDVGFGIRFVTPAFPIRLDYGYGLNHRPGEKKYEINFGIGSLF
ncbi:MAG: outer membrane protein assembly factor BamA [Elusimicrobia bacterium]|nr:outer membrane protein assembly factor BamA [Elusimicrobiota bacterium]